MIEKLEGYEWIANGCEHRGPQRLYADIRDECAASYFCLARLRHRGSIVPDVSWPSQFAFLFSFSHSPSSTARRRPELDLAAMSGNCFSFSGCHHLTTARLRTQGLCSGELRRCRALGRASRSHRHRPREELRHCHRLNVAAVLEKAGFERVARGLAKPVLREGRQFSFFQHLSPMDVVRLGREAQ